MAKTQKKGGAAVVPMFEDGKRGRLLSVADIMDATADLTPRPVYIKSLGGHIYMRPMTGDEGIAYAEMGADPKNRGKQRVLLILFCACTPNGERLFSLEDVNALGQRSVRVLNELQMFAAKLCGFVADDDDEKDDSKRDPLAREKNDSGEADSGASPTA